MQSIYMCSVFPGEVFVLDDGGEVDLDLGNYERFLNVTLHKDNNITTGVYFFHFVNVIYAIYVFDCCCQVLLLLPDSK